MGLSLFSARGTMRDGSGFARAGMTVGRSVSSLMDGGGISFSDKYGCGSSYPPPTKIMYGYGVSRLGYNEALVASPRTGV